jgi:AbiU2
VTTRTAKEAEAHNISLMGEALGRQYSALWQEVAAIHSRWAHYVELYGSKPERVQILNRVAPLLFRIIQDDLWEAMLLHIACLTDPPASMGRKKRTNLTLQNLPALVDDMATKTKLQSAIDEVIVLSGFCRDWRNRHIAHRDLNLALDQAAEPLTGGSRIQVRKVLAAITKVLNVVELHYKDGQSFFDIPHQGHDALGLLRALDDGYAVHQERWQRLRRGQSTEEDFNLKEI